MKLKYLGLLSFAVIPFVVSCSSDKETDELITKVHDGDTLTTSSGERLRIFGIDTAEVSTSAHQIELDTWTPTDGIEGLYGSKATIVAQDMFLNQTAHITRYETDKYGRTVASVSSHGIDLGMKLVYLGLARVAYFDVANERSPYYSTEFDYYKTLLELQFESARAHRGFWESPELFKEIFPKS